MRRVRVSCGVRRIRGFRGRRVRGDELRRGMRVLVVVVVVVSSSVVAAKRYTHLGFLFRERERGF